MSPRWMSPVLSWMTRPRFCTAHPRRHAHPHRVDQCHKGILRKVHSDLHRHRTRSRLYPGCRTPGQMATCTRLPHNTPWGMKSRRTCMNRCSSALPAGTLIQVRMHKIHPAGRCRSARVYTGCTARPARHTAPSRLPCTRCQGNIRWGRRCYRRCSCHPRSAGPLRKGPPIRTGRCPPVSSSQPSTDRNGCKLPHPRRMSPRSVLDIARPGNTLTGRTADCTCRNP